jgi:biotin-(acetyl-CoA carboxylase) ligase
VESSVPWNCLKIKNTLLEKLLCNYTLLDENKYKISELWLQAAKLKDKNVIFIDDKNQSYLGIVDGFTDDGALIMICKNKKLTFYTGELTINS